MHVRSNNEVLGVFSCFFLLLLFLSCVEQVHGNNSSSEWFESCNRLVSCGSLEAVGFPFWGGRFRPKECGYPHLGVRCDDGFTATLVINGVEFILLDVIPEDQRMRITRKDYYSKGICPKTFLNTSLDLNLFQFVPQTENLTVLYGCKPPTNPLLSPFKCKIEGVDRDTGYYVSGIVNPVEYGCNISVVIQSRSLPSILMIGLREVFKVGFGVNYKMLNDDEAFCKNCEGQNSNGTCGYDYQRNKTVCVCPYGSEDTVCHYNVPSTQDAAGKKSSKDLKLKLIIGLCVGGVGIVVAVCIALYLRNRHSDHTSIEAQT